MVSTETLLELAGLVLPPDEEITWAKEFPGGPSVSVRTPSRILFVEVVRGWLRVSEAPGVAGIVTVTREDEDHSGSAPQRVFLLLDDETPIDLDDPPAVAELGRALRHGGLDPLAYAEILVTRHWPAPGPREVITDPRDRPSPRTWEDEQGDFWLSFYAARQDPDTTDPDVTLWSVRVPLDGPVTWLRRPAAR
jgi:hypothetical protein